ncbi:MAG TPA: ABC transporter permease [Planctomycetota bacterium]|nr:ABC transporter permease [Planctomycetota bacterium]
MSLPILALFERSLRVESRAMGTYVKRLGLAAFIFFCLISAHLTSELYGAAGLRFFSSVVYATFIFLSLAGVGYFASAVAEEKEEATLGLLKMSNLNALAILLGKSTSRLLGVVTLLLAQVPFTLLAITLGGVSLGQVVAAYATLLAYLLLLCNVALFASVACQQVRSATVVTGLLVGGFLLAAPLCHALAWEFPPGSGAHRAVAAVAEGLTRANPVARIGEIMATGFDEGPFGVQVVSNALAALAFFGLAWLTFEFFTREEKDVSPVRTAFVRRWSPLRWFGVSRPWGLALAWKDFHFLAGGRMMVVGRFVGTIALVGVFAWIAGLNRHREVRAEEIGGMLMFCSLGLAALDLAGYVSRMFRTEVQWHTLPELMLLPVSTRQLAWSKFVGVLPALVPYAVTFFLGALLCPEGFGEGVEAILGTVYGWHGICQYIAFVCFAGYLSVVWRRAGAPAALGIWLVGNWVLFFFLSFTFRSAGSVEGMFVLLSILFFVFAVVCYRATMARVERLAGE